ncbi:unnamed protein product [Zymoseptoria tritici ST99CH_3D7]|uniref:Uncharacterized protein n=1 Tax=Zymoseptoria tritici (strain ST99CH_3D7) TaxID=1276538 RepID=A0A1X7RSC1_ZYMT9|nr:unnamed protein product [Zymoseptoria tritici ST99CH_3D7]
MSAARSACLGSDAAAGSECERNVSTRSRRLKYWLSYLAKQGSGDQGFARGLCRQAWLDAAGQTSVPWQAFEDLELYR